MGVKRMKLNGMTLNPYFALKYGFKIIQKYPMELSVTTDNFGERYDKIYKINYAQGIFWCQHGQRLRFDPVLNELIAFLLTLKIKTIEIYCPTRSVYAHIICYDYKEHFAEIIQKYWRKYRLKTARIRNDLVLHGLAEWWYHPSRISFDM
jgi:hypothetical protein